MFAGRLVEAITFPAGSGGYEFSRRGSNPSAQGETGPDDYTQPRRVTATERIGLSRALTAGESLVLYWTGARGLNHYQLTQGNSAAFVGALVRHESSHNVPTGAGGSSGGTLGFYPFANSLNAPITLYVTDLQYELVDWETNGNPGEFLQTGSGSAPFYGANVDGVKYFDTLNGNTVDANGVVTEATGAAISPAPYYEYDIQRTYAGLWSNDLTNAAWVKTTMTATKDQTGADGRANSATRLTATAANATVLQTLTSSSQKRITQAHVKRVTGSGTIQMTQDNGTTWTPITVTSSWTQVYIPEVTSANPVFGFRIVTSGDEIAVQYVNHVLAEGGVTSPITTTTTSVTRNADSLTYPMPVGLNTKGAAYADGISLSGVAGANIIGGVGGGHMGVSDTSVVGYQLPGAANDTALINDGTNTGTVTAGSWSAGRKIASRWGNGKMRNFSANAAGTEANFDGSMGAGPISVAPVRGRSGIRDLKMWKSIRPDAYLQGLTQ